MDHSLEEMLDSRSLVVIVLVVSKVKALRHVYRLMDTEYIFKTQKRKGVITKKAPMILRVTLFGKMFFNFSHCIINPSL